MKQETPPKKSAKPAQTREDRLKAALKANLARRKTQTRARNAVKPDGDTKEG
ncbi:hypothetical protein ROA7450_03392 [Roseovarius albus]|uniref:Uncharacterized protein n=1 Tax=Roseovarius albus TaxID=1247867 RepID=A0A1X6ZX63_9RHOB|nr:hypothetical protein [Roseovarius albus]SLN64221.1 hypothetical protein ROA7450_03392 [Roseovarius albus]